MEANVKKVRRIGLSALFWRYLISTGLSLLAIPIVMLFLILLLIQGGFLLPANTAAIQAQAAVPELVSGDMLPEELPYYIRWAVFSHTGEFLSSSEHLSSHQRKLLESAFHSRSSVQSAFPYAQYYQDATLPDHRLCILQYDFSVPYSSPSMQDILPDFQVSSVVVMLLEAVAAAALLTRRFSRFLKRDADALSAATKALSERQLDVAFSNTVHVKELQETLNTMDTLRKSLLESLQEQWALEEQRRQEVAALAHDLKSPLAIISGNSELLAEDALSDEQRQSAEAILRSCERMNGYIGQLRTLALQDQGSWGTWETCSMYALFEEWCSMARSLCTAHSIHLSAHSPADISCQVLHESLTRAVQNLLDNAVRFTPPGGHISFSVCCENSTISICVCDSGPGFTPEALARAGHAFYMQDASRPANGHMGLGLYTARRVAELHGGKLILENLPSGARAALQIRVCSISVCSQ